MLVEIPREPTLRQSVGPDEKISLLLIVYARMGLFGGLSVATAIIIGAISLSGASLVIVATTSGPFGAAGDVVISLAMAGFGICVLAAAATLLTDRYRPGPVLVIDPETIFDKRLASQPIPWSAVAHASIVYQSPSTRTGPVAVRLELRTAVSARHNPFRLGSLGFRWGRRPNELYLPLFFLSARPHVLAQLIMSLVRRHGGEIG